jgi:hypothetical protein
MSYFFKNYFGGCWNAGLFLFQLLLIFVIWAYGTGGGYGTRFFYQLIALFLIAFITHMALTMVNHLKR